jgi:fluoride exporter
MSAQRMGGRPSRRTFSSRIASLVAGVAQLNPFKSMALSIVLVFIGGATGSMWRYWWSGFVAQRFGEVFPFGTLVVNLSGSILIGVISSLLAHVQNSGLAAALQQFLVIGICGGLTTFSSFSLQTYSLINEGKWLVALANIIFSTGLSFGCVALGWQITEVINL